MMEDNSKIVLKFMNMLSESDKEDIRSYALNTLHFSKDLKYETIRDTWISSVILGLIKKGLLK